MSFISALINDPKDTGSGSLRNQAVKAFHKPISYSGILVVIIIVVWYSLFLIQKIDLSVVDLGRHLMNGQVVLENITGSFSALKTNYYSYTNPDYPVINHHWGSGLLFFLFFKIGAYGGAHLLFILMSITAFFLFFKIAVRCGGSNLAAVIAVILIPLIASRTEVRPEVFTLLFCGIFLTILWQYRDNQKNWHFLLILPILEILWVNLHIYFVFGLFIAGVFFLERLISRPSKPEIIRLGAVFTLIVMATLINPSGIYGAIEPLNIIAHGYNSYRVVENQSIGFLDNLGFISTTDFRLYKIVFLLTLLSYIALIIKKKNKYLPSNFLIFIVFAVLGYLAIRNIALFALFVLPLMAFNINQIISKDKQTSSLQSQFLHDGNTVIIITSLIFIFGMFGYPTIVRSYNNFGIGLKSGVNDAAEFIKAEKISGPYFNNYDNGGYMIHHFFPQEKVFIDNRPEAYPPDFFTKTYIPMMENSDIWEKMDKIYNFNAIICSYRDMTPWAQTFLVRMIDDKDWAPIFIDNYIIVFVRQNEKNAPIINKYKIDRGVFSTTI